MILRAFKDKFIRLAREEDGVALVVTLAVFFFIYLICMGVYAVGTNVRERIHLQNACDAAAYSAAVVQADTLSRIATINRAMSWTYVQMTRRQMDYIVYKWLRHTCDHYERDRLVAENWHRGSNPACPLEHGTHPNGWFIGADGEFGTVDLNTTYRPSIRTNVDPACDAFDSSHMNDSDNALTFYGVSEGRIDHNKLADQISKDKQVLDDMCTFERELVTEMPSRVRNVVRGILAASVAQDRQEDFAFMLKQCENPLANRDAEGYFAEMKNDDNDELRLLSFGGVNALTIFEAFRTGINDWFVHSNARSGIQRVYRQNGNRLSSAWKWWSAKWTCYYVPPTAFSSGYWVHPKMDYLGSCPHLGCVYTDACQRNGTWFAPGLHGRLYAEDLHDEYYDGGIANPLLMTERYFASLGTISVGLARKNENPVARMIRGAVGDLGGIFAAFNPFVEWTFAFASAKAGYRTAEESVTFGRDYWIDWKEGGTADNDESKWNLYTSDWDAVLIPVRMAGSKAEDSAWDVGNTGFLEDWVDGFWQPLGGGGNSVATQIPAGGTGKSMSDHFSQVEKESANWWYEWAGEQTHVTNNENDGENQKIDVKWQIGSPGGRIDWEQLTERMFH